MQKDSGRSTRTVRQCCDQLEQGIFVTKVCCLEREIRRILAILTSHTLHHLFYLFYPFDPFTTPNGPIPLDFSPTHKPFSVSCEPFHAQRVSSITASLFNDQEMNDILFIISESPPGSWLSEFYSGSAKNALGLSRNGNCSSPDDSARGGGPGAVPGIGRNARLPEYGAREEYICARTNVLSARSEDFRNSTLSVFAFRCVHCTAMLTSCLVFANKSVFNKVPNVIDRRGSWIDAYEDLTTRMRILPLRGRHPRV